MDQTYSVNLYKYIYLLSMFANFYVKIIIHLNCVSNKYVAWLA